MINKKEFDLLLQEISQIENKLVELKVLNQFEKANEYENALEKIRMRAKDIQLNTDETEGFDNLSLEVFRDLILLDSEVDYFILKTNNIIESANENQIDAEALKKINNLWHNLEKDLKTWEESEHNPIEEIEYSKHIGKITLDIIIYQLQVEAIIDFTKIFKYCRKEFLVNAIKAVLFEGAEEAFQDDITRRRLVNLAKTISEKDLYDYKLWQQILMIKNVRSRDDHIEIIGNINEIDNRKYVIEEKRRKKIELEGNTGGTQNLEVYEEYESIFASIKKWFMNLTEISNQKAMAINWGTIYGPAFKAELIDGQTKYGKDYLSKNIIEKTRKLTIATNGLSKYHFDQNAKWENLEELEFLSGKNTASVNLSPDKTYCCIGNGCFANSPKLRQVSLGKIELIGENAFENCEQLTEIIFPKSLMNIGDDAFLGCKNLNKIIFEGNLKLYIMERPQNVINCFKETNLEDIVFPNITSAFNLAIIDCPNLKNIFVADLSGIKIPFKTCKYRFFREEGIVSFVGEKALNLWKKRNSNIRFFELTEEDKNKYNIK